MSEMARKWIVFCAHKPRQPDRDSAQEETHLVSEILVDVV